MIFIIFTDKMACIAIKANEVNKFLTVPDVEDVQVRLCDSNCDDEEYSTSQIWIKDGSIIKWAERPYMYLGLNERNELCLTKKLDAKKCFWTINSSKLCLKSEPSIGLSLVNDVILGQNQDHLTWSFIPVKLPEPATSCHLRYGPELPEYIDSASKWYLECSVQVEKSGFCTYFMVVGFGPGGYCGIQELHDGRRKAIFSVWNNKNIDVELVEANPEAEVTKFGGEGTGIKTMLDFLWNEGDLVTFKVEGQIVDDFWRCSCKISSNGTDHFMSMVKRSVDGGPLLNRTGFYSFVEDWNRCKGAKGYKTLRKALFLNPKLDGNFIPNAEFTKVETGSDAFAADFAKGWVCSDGFGLQTGVEDICPNHTLLQRR